jgi:hypothetical protein
MRFDSFGFFCLALQFGDWIACVDSTIGLVNLQTSFP